MDHYIFYGKKEGRYKSALDKIFKIKLTKLNKSHQKRISEGLTNLSKGKKNTLDSEINFTKQELLDFGAAFLGPFVGHYIQKLITKAEQNSQIVCLAREGFLIHNIINYLRSRNYIKLNKEAVYLKTSRYLCSRITIFDDKINFIVLNTKFSGMLGEFLKTKCEVDDIRSSNKLLTKQIILPEEIDDVKH